MMNMCLNSLRVNSSVCNANGSATDVFIPWLNVCYLLYVPQVTVVEFLGLRVGWLHAKIQPHTG